MTDPATVSCLTACFASLFCKGGSDEDAEGGDVTLPSVQAQNSCNKWLCCFGTNCCNSTTTVVSGRHFGDEHVGLHRNKTINPLSRNHVAQLVLQATLDEDEDVDDTSAEQTAREINQAVMQKFIKAKGLPKVCVVAAVRSLAEQDIARNAKLQDWDESATVSLTQNDIVQMNAVTASEKLYFNVARQTLQRLHASQALDAKKAQRAEATTLTQLGERHRMTFFKKTRVITTEGDAYKFNHVALAKDILDLFEITRENAVELAKEIKRPFKGKKVTKQEIWDALLDQAFIKELTLKKSPICHDSRLVALSEIAKTVNTVAEMTLDQYLQFRSPALPSALASKASSVNSLEGQRSSPGSSNSSRGDHLAPAVPQAERRRGVALDDSKFQVATV